MPVVLAGGAAGFKMGQHVMAPMAWFGDLFISIANGFGLPLTTFGEQGKAPAAESGVGLRERVVVGVLPDPVAVRALEHAS